jgi:phosphoserine aminotransferase
MKKHNFSSGPAILPTEVLTQAAEGVANLDGSGLSILELSHRSKAVGAIFDEARARIRTLLSLSDEYEVLFMTGGASTQFVLCAMNLLNDDQTAAYADTGTWSAKAIEAARQFGTIDVLASSKKTTYDHIPKGYEVPQTHQYFHITSNNTIYGTQYHTFPDAGNVPLIADMSSDFLSRPFDIRPFGLVYAGAQKNLGPSGVTIVIVRKEILGKVTRKIPAMFDYNTFIAEQSMYNTPPVFPVYVSMLTLRWIEKHYGNLAGMAAYNEKKAAILYDEIDRNPLFKGNVAFEDRSLMNVCFTMHNRELEPVFQKFATENGCVDVNGHRSVGGFRASIYNAMSLESVEFLVSLMQMMEKTHG